MAAYNQPQYDPITIGSLVEQGFLVSVRDISGQKQSFAGADFTGPFVDGMRGAFQGAIIPGAPGDYGSPRCHIYDKANNILRVELASVVSEVVEDDGEYRWYGVSIADIPATAHHYLFGTQEWTSGVECRVFGVQHHLSPDAAYSMRVDDFPLADADSTRLDLANFPPRGFG